MRLRPTGGRALAVGLAAVNAAVIAGVTLAARRSVRARVLRERRRSASAVVAAREAERRRIGRDLHDQLGQDLTVALLSLADLGRRVGPAEADAVRATASVLRAGLDHVRELAAALRPSVLDDLGLAAALESLLRAVDRPGLATRCTVGNVTGLSADWELAAYRVAQEAVTNAVRHAGASRVALVADRVGDAVEVRVSDDGRGGVRPTGFGVTGMVERADAVGGRLTITSTDAGSTIRLLLPLAGHPGGAR